MVSDPSPGRLILVRHGRTPWARTGQHTGRTDISLDDVGVAQARSLPAVLTRVLGGRAPSLVLCSPLERAWRTAELSGLGEHSPIKVEPNLMEWDYGAYEGLTTPAIREQRGDDWTAFRDGMAPGGPGQFPGESLTQVADRGARVLERVRAHWREQEAAGGEDEQRPSGDVVCVGHGHALRILATVWLRLPPTSGAALLLDPAAVCVLDTEHTVPGVRYWNLSPALFGDSPSG